MADARGIDEAAIVARQLTIGAVAARVIEVRTEDAGAEIVRHQSPRCASEEREGEDVPLQEGTAVLPKDRIEELVTAVAEGHEKGVETPLTLLLRVVPTTGVEEVDLRLLARR